MRNSIESPTISNKDVELLLHENTLDNVLSSERDLVLDILKKRISDLEIKQQ